MVTGLVLNCNILLICCGPQLPNGETVEFRIIRGSLKACIPVAEQGDDLPQLGVQDPVYPVHDGLGDFLVKGVRDRARHAGDGVAVAANRYGVANGILIPNHRSIIG